MVGSHPAVEGRRRTIARRAGVLALLATVTLAGSASGQGSVTELQGQIGHTQDQERSLQSAIQSDTNVIQGFQGRISDLQVRLGALEQSLAIETAQLHRVQARLRAARARLVRLRARFARDRAVLARQLVAEYESSRPDVVTVLLEANGFSDLLERVDAMRRVERGNVQVTDHVRAERDAVTRQAARLADLEGRQQRVTTAIAVQRDEVAGLRLELVRRQATYIRSRNSESARLGALRSRRQVLEQRLSRAQARAMAAQAQPAPAPAVTGTPVTGSGEYGFFPASGTNYSVGDEPELAARLNRLGQALHLHLIGISGYRTPQHSVEVGGFTDDPHTRGEASDTPGVEGVPEATLQQYGLTRPFGGAAEADHIQLSG